MVSCKEAVAILNSLELKPAGVEKLFITDAIDRVLAEDIKARDNLPEFRTSAMDGYALKLSKSDRYRVVDKIPAGEYIEYELKEGEAMKVYTGSTIPQNSDLVAPIEVVEELENGSIAIKSSLKSGFAIREIGESYSEGELLIERGSKIGFAEVGVIASLNIAEVLVYQKPKVSIFSTGSEILEIAQKRENPSQIRSSNNYTIYAICKKYGLNPVNLGIVKDDRELIERALKSAIESSDVVVTTGGVSVGDFDFIRDIVEKFDSKLLFKKVNIKPGQHIKVMKIKNKLIFALPGFALSSTITFLLFAIPFIKRIEGIDFKYRVLNAILKEPISKVHSKFEFKPCNLSYESGNYYVDFENKKSGSSAILTNMLGQRSALVQLEEDIESKSVGDVVEVITFEE